MRVRTGARRNKDAGSAAWDFAMSVFGARSVVRSDALLDDAVSSSLAS
jgi:hypothetical protein